MRILVVGERDVSVAPMAAALLYHERRLRSIDDLEVASAGVGRPGHRMAAPVADLLIDRGIDVSRKRSRELDRAMLGPADLVLVTRPRLERHVRRIDATASVKTRRLVEFCSNVEARRGDVTTATWLRGQLRRTRDLDGSGTLGDLVAPAEDDPLALLEVADRMMMSVTRLVDAAWPELVIDLTENSPLVQSSSSR